ncbi:LOW QUALITY PROTEIN: kinesin-like protein KIN-7I [Drosophila teissieri]|uniref:LOW QUALITY PROTEIN: kinesin-like protein KIN-7I n=1 Tax=Drosophila teissieri TaxID=7243 RepID=UPI001CB9F8C8|nr:LOW QUALITY PROTEIN: kinesin-like protein KIN-7I [Drosophila teissieri]
MSAKNASSILACIKLRPCELGLTSLWQVKEGRSIQLADSHAEPCVFDYVFDEGANNQEVFDRMARHIVHACMQGFNGTIFAYGQTSSGKTYTMMGDGQNPGVMVLAAKEIFQQISSETERDFLLRVGYIEIYNEKIYDLLNKKNQDLKIHESGNGIVNVNCEECIITSEDDLLRLLCMGNKERTVGETNMNERSSRSHAIFRIIIESRKSHTSDDDTVVQSVLSLVDLAGSEHVDQAAAQSRSSSLTSFCNLVRSLSENVVSKSISFRDSKITRIMQPSLGGNVLTSVICTIKPSVVEDSISTISFATCAKKIRCNPQVCEIDAETTMMRRLDRGIKMQKERLAEEERKNASQLVLQSLERSIKRDMSKIISSASLSEHRLQKRRRTWTSSASGSEGETPVPALPVPEESRLPRPSKLTNLPKPTFFHNTTHSQRREIAPKTKSIHQSLKEDNTDSRPGRPKQLEKEAASSIPSVKQMPKMYKESVPNCDALQTEISALTASNQRAKQTIEKYEEQIERLKATIERLEMEKREAVNLGEQLAKSKHMEEELLSVLSEKESTIESLQLSLEELSRDVLRNSKEDHMRSMCPELESSCERICNKCHELERLLSLADATGVESIACQCDQLRSEIAATRIKLESMQSAFSHANCEVSQKTTDCERLSRQITTAQDDFGQLQEKYNNLEHKWMTQQLAIETMQADYNGIQQKYQKLLGDYKYLGVTSDEQCQQLQDENAKLQAEIGTLKERVEEAQRKLLEAPNPDSLSVELTVQNQELKKRLSELQMKFNEIQQNYDCLSNQLVESIQEGDVLREELKQRTTSFDVESMKSSGVGTECSDPENDLDSDLLQQFTKLSESIQEIEFVDYSGGRRLFTSNQAEQDQGVESFKLCLERAEFIEGDGKQQDASDSVLLKGSLKRQRFQIVKINQKQNGTKEEDQMQDVVFQLEQEVERKNNLFEEEKAIVNTLRVQITSLEAALLKNSEKVKRIDDYEMQIETLKKQNAEIKILYEELRSKDAAKEEQESQEVVNLKTSLAELRNKVCNLQTELKDQLEQMQLKDGKISELQTDIGEMSEQYSSMELKLTKLEEDANCQAQASSDDHQLEYRSITAHESLKLETPIQEQTTLTFEYESRIEQLEESLERAQEELSTLEKRKTDEINSLQLEYMVKIETSEIVNRSKFRAYCLELEENKERYDSSVKTLEEQLLQASAKLDSVTTQCQAELEAIKGSLQEKITQVERERNELVALHKAELEKIRETVKEKESAYKEKLSQALEEREKGICRLEAMRNTIAELLKTKSDQNLEFEGLQMEKRQLEKLYDESLLQVEQLQRTVDQKSSEAQAVVEEPNSPQNYCDEHVRDLELLRWEKTELLSEIQKVHTQHSKTLKKLEEIEAEMITLTSQKELDRCEIEEKLDTFKSKEADLTEALHCAQLKLHAHDELVRQHERLKVCLSDSTELSANLQKKMERLHSELLASQEGISSQDSEIEKLRSELKHALDANTTARTAQQGLESQLKEVEETISVQAGQFEREIADLKGSVDELQLKLKSLQEAKDNLESGNEELKGKLKEAQDLQNIVDDERKLNASLQDDLGKLEHIKTDLEEQLRAKKEEFERRSNELSLLGRDKIGELTKECENLRSDLEAQTNNFLKEKETLNLTISDLKRNNQQLEEQLTILSEKDNSNSRLETEFASLLESSKKMQSDIKAANKLNLEMEKKVRDLTKECETLRSDLQSKDEAMQTQKELLDNSISNLKKKHRKSEEKLTTLNEDCEKLTTLNKALNGDCEKLRLTLKSKESDLRKNQKELDEKLAILNEKNANNDRLVAQLTSNEAVFQSLREDSIKQNEKRLEMEEKVDKLTREYEKLRSTLKTREISFLSEKERMDGTISSLSEGKRDLEEKLYSVTEVLTKLQHELAAEQAHKVDAGDWSFERNGSPTSAAVSATKKPVDRHFAGSVPRKSLSFETAVRKNRRMTAYDEHRKQSCWNEFRDCGTMTDPVDSNCH